jgi:hypothetical protein
MRKKYWPRCEDSMPDKVEKTGDPTPVTDAVKPAVQVAPVSAQGRRRLMGCMEGTARIVGDLESPATAASDWAVFCS